MLSSVLTSEVAVQVNIGIMRAFAALKNYFSERTRIDAEIDRLKTKLELLFQEREADLEAINDLSEELRNEIAIINQAIAELSLKVSTPKVSPRTKIGFK